MEALDRNVHHYNKSGSACVTQVGLGEVAVCVAFSHDILKKGPGQGFPVTLSFPADGAGFEIGGMALIKNGPDHDEARLFMDWVLSRQAQSLMQQWYRIPLNPGAERAPGIVPASELNLVDYDAIKAGGDKRRLIEKWRLTTGQ
jgi:iron(III) transport system substrate-binding protein